MALCPCPLHPPPLYLLIICGRKLPAVYNTANKSHLYMSPLCQPRPFVFLNLREAQRKYNEWSRCRIMQTLFIYYVFSHPLLSQDVRLDCSSVFKWRMNSLIARQVAIVTSRLLTGVELLLRGWARLPRRHSLSLSGAGQNRVGPPQNPTELFYY